MDMNVLTAVGSAMTLGIVTLIGAPAAAAAPEPPPVCYANQPSVSATEFDPCLAPGDIEYQQGAHQPTYDGANPLTPPGVNPFVPDGTNKNNAG
ncbi:hypothetical protein BKG82_01655 [Mycobacteroides chelonae]|uniref:Intersectin-EH binding protein Ibp1 n=3 Tax=Mycobacteriaceae TaxID=1762 RepID=A0A1S1LUY6_MYCCH|nr:hypothetical protein BKG75_01420 [Mycobacteroides chelonae]OHU19539.1 hypothetical protein BKG74_16760 [Mycobacteroides chelonae]OHU28605.1 hypothetical protein BKG77_03650 [Mycobacteroides chelonae]OHU32284.1 hypothetical protein BKG78_18595 [Mycobacteroides chelonae]OHU60820.1 hypothetical protein BKG82_01655 [Mycobacteroides chelonae]